MSRQVSDDGNRPPVSPTARESDARSGRLWQRLFWFAALWLLGVVTVTVIAYGIRAMIMP